MVMVGRGQGGGEGYVVLLLAPLALITGLAASLELHAPLARVRNKASLTQWGGNLMKSAPLQVIDSLRKALLSAPPLAPVRPCPRQAGRAKRKAKKEQ